MKHHRTQSGFTLIETLLYVAFLAFMLTSALGATFTIVRNSSSLSDHIAIAEEDHFLEQKLRWALAGSTIISPSLGTHGSVLIVNRPGFASNPITFDPTNLVAREITVASVSFEHLASPEGLRATFFLNNTPFTITTYLRK